MAAAGDLSNFEQNLPIIKYVAVESVISLTEMNLFQSKLFRG